MADDREPPTVGDLILSKMHRADGSRIDPWDSLSVSYLLTRGQWYDGTPIDPHQRVALQLLLDDRSPLNRPVPRPAE